MNTQTAPILLTADEVAAMLGVSERTLWRLLSAGKVPKPVRFGRNTRGREAEVARAIKSLAVTRLIELASNTTASFEVRAIATDALRSFETRVGSNNPHNRELREELSRFFSRPMEPQRPSPALPPPPGDPIGAGR